MKKTVTFGMLALALVTGSVLAQTMLPKLAVKKTYKLRVLGVRGHRKKVPNYEPQSSGRRGRGPT